MKTTPKILTPQQLDLLLQSLNKKYKLITLLMADAGLRVTEVVRLQIKHFNFQEQIVQIHSLKKRPTAKDKIRTLPLTQRTLNALTQYWSTLKNKSPEAYLFPPSAQSKQPHLSRKMVWRRLKKHSNGYVNPHMLRHYFATRVVNEGNDIRTAQKMLGHSSQQTTEIYLHVPQQKIQAAINSIEPKTNSFNRFFNKLLNSKPSTPDIHITPARIGLTLFHIGRKKELQQLHNLAQKQVNVLLLGPQGIGKSHLLDNYHKGQIIRIDDFRSPKKTLGGLLLELYDHDKEAILQMLLKINSRFDLEKLATRESIKRLCELAIQATTPKEYTLIFDDLTDITKYGVTIMEKLKNHFIIIAAARRIKLEHSTFLSNFEKIELQPLSRPESIELINKLSLPIANRITDYEAYKNRIWEDTQGIPLYIIEMIERLSKEPLITPETTATIRHTASKQEIDFTLPLIVLFSSLMVLRYLGNELGDNAGALKLIGGLGLIVAIFSRHIFRTLKRKFV